MFRLYGHTLVAQQEHGRLLVSRELYPDEKTLIRKIKEELAVTQTLATSPQLFLFSIVDIEDER